jgi:hypothetical protein
MSVLICPRCQHVSPEYAIYCHFDGVVLQVHQQAAVHRLPFEFTFPSGRRCKTFDELAQGCQEEWTLARDLLMRDVFAQFFQTCGRADLVRAANDAKVVGNSDIALTTFLASLPGTRTQTPKVDLNPRRILLGTVAVGETKSVPLTITNAGQGMLQGTVEVTEGQDWLSLGETKGVHKIDINAPRTQAVKLTINTTGVAAGQTYGARLTVVTNGGVVEVPIRMDLASQPFPKAPFQGVRAQREMAEKMRSQPKAAVPILESGEVQRWFALNGWTYPVVGPPVKGVASVQQFFEGMGLSKPPVVQLSKSEFRFTCKYKESVRGQVTLQTAAKKWVYAQVTSDSRWLKPGQSQVAGPQQATLPFEIDSTLWTQGEFGDGKITFEANGGQKLTLKVTVEMQGAPAIPKPRSPSPVANASGSLAPVAADPSPFVLPARSAPTPSVKRTTGGMKFVPAFVTLVLMCLALRTVLVPFVDFLGRSSVASSAAVKLEVKPSADSKFAQTGGWLELPWMSILAGAETTFKAEVFQKGNQSELKAVDFRHYFATYFIRAFVLATFWIGGIVGAVLVLRRGGSVLDMPWGVVAGAFAGLIVSATVAAFFLAVEIIPHTLWQIALGPKAGVGFLMLWVLLAVTCWLFVAIGLGIIVPLIAPLRRLVIDPFQGMIAGALSAVGMKRLAAYWTPE